MTIPRTFYLLLCVTCFGVNSCSLMDGNGSDCPETTHRTNHLTSSDKNTVPYSGFDSLTLVYLPPGVKYTFLGLGMQTGFAKRTEIIWEECPSNEADCEYQTYRFKTATGKDPIDMALYISDYNGSSDINVSFRGRSFQFGPYYLNPNLSIDSLSIQGEIYRQVFVVRRMDNPTDTNAYLLYTVKDGIVKMKIWENEIWEKIKN